jgi:hypothetical protein
MLGNHYTHKRESLQSTRKVEHSKYVTNNVKEGDVQGKRLGKSLVETLLGNNSRVFREPEQAPR